MRLKFLTIIGASLVVALSYCGPLSAAEPSAAGLWEQLDNYGHSWFLFFERDGVYEGSVVKMFIRPGTPANPICNNCPGEKKNQLVLGTSLVNGMKRTGLNYDQFAQVFGVEAGLNPNYPYGNVALFYQGVPRWPGDIQPQGYGGTLTAARPVIVTGATDPTSRALAASLNASDYIVKPIDLEDLAAAINRRIAEV